MKLLRDSLSLLLLVIFFTTTLSSAELTKGVTIGDWLNTDEGVHIQTTRYQKVDFENIKSLGFDHVRIYVNFNVFEVQPPDYALSEIQYRCLDNALMWAEEVGLSVIIANSEDGFSTGEADAVKERIVTTWKSVAGRYAAKSDMVAYEILVAPGETLAAEAWNDVAAAIIAGIREVDTTHSIIVGPVNYYSITALGDLQKFTDANLIYAFNFMELPLFTHQGFTFHDVAYNTLNVPFPYDAGSMPDMAEGGDGAEIAEAAYTNYPTQGNADWIKSQLDVAAQFGTDNSASVYCASFGVFIGQGNKTTGWLVPQADRDLYLQTISSHLTEKGVGWALADYRGRMGLFHSYDFDPDLWMAYAVYPYDINTATCEALGLTAPEPGLYSPDPLEDGFVIYDDEATPLARWGQWWGGDSEHSLYSQEAPAVGQYCMSAFYLNQYAAGDFFFPLYLDMSILAEDGYVLDFFLRCDWEEAHIQARFEDSNEDLEDHPWRMNYHVDNNIVPFDGDWQRVTIPLTSMDDQGAWDPDDQVWYGGGQGLFDWERVQRFQFVSETAAQPDAEIFIDRVRIVSADAVESLPEQQPITFELLANYPNPFNPSTTIRYILPNRSDINLSIYNVRGELVKTLVADTRNAGSYSAQWDGTDANNLQVGSGVYFYKLKAENFEQTRSMLLVR